MAEDMLFEAGIIHRRGTIEGKNTIVIATKSNKSVAILFLLLCCTRSGATIKSTSSIHPGFDDFAGEMISSLRVADTCVVAINAQHGAEVGTDLIWNYVNQFESQ